jgi:quinol monooxygenase YgiN
MTDTTGTPQTVFTSTPPAGDGQIQSAFRHLILFKMHEGTTQETVDEALRLMVAMCATPEVEYYEVGVSQDTRKGIILFEFIDFADEAAFEAFKATPAHLAYASFIRNHADWIIGDYTVAV